MQQVHGARLQATAFAVLLVHAFHEQELVGVDVFLQVVGEPVLGAV